MGRPNKLGRSWHHLLSPRQLTGPDALQYLRQIGAIAESSRYLARAMVAAIKDNKPGLVVELGPGFGAITRALVKKMADPHRLLLLEVEGTFIPVLKKRFPKVIVRHDSAERLDHHVAGEQVQAIVSGLPLRSLPDATLKHIGEALKKVMDDKTLYIQFTYDLRPNRPACLPNINLERIDSRVVWRNLPPARVDLFRLAR